MEYMSGMDGNGYAGKTLEMLFIKQNGSSEITRFFEETNLGFMELEIEPESGDEKKMKSETVHRVYDADGNFIGRRNFPTEKM